MYLSIRTLALSVAASVSVGVLCAAQEVQPPFTWEGEGAATFISESGTIDSQFEFKLSVDGQGIVEGKATWRESSHAMCNSLQRRALDCGSVGC